jgi:hypothetical protein
MTADDVLALMAEVRTRWRAAGKVYDAEIVDRMMTRIRDAKKERADERRHGEPGGPAIGRRSEDRRPSARGKA